jgi:hypothetical protein
MGQFRFKPPPQLGATGRFPKGKLHAGDEGELCFAVAHRAGKVIVNFGKAVAWIGLDPNDASELAEALLHHAALARGGET